MEPTYLADYMDLAFRLGHISASLGSFDDPSAALAEWQDDIDELSDRMDELSLRESNSPIISFLEQGGDLTQSPDLLFSLIDEADSNLNAVIHAIRNDTEVLRNHPGRLPEGVRDILTPRLLATLPVNAKEEYEEAKKNLLSGAWRSAARSMGVAVEATLAHLYTLVTKEESEGKSWEEMQNGLYARKDYNGKPAIYLVGLLRDIQKNYRNPTAHPGEPLYDDDAYAAFYHCTVALRRMTEAINSMTVPHN